MFQEELPEYNENMQEMDILDMNILDDAENGIPADDDMENFHSDEDTLMNEDDGAFEQENEPGDSEVRNSFLSVQFHILFIYQVSFKVAAFVSTFAES